MMFIALSCILNIIGDIVLVKYAGMGVAGVAIATIGSQGFSMFAAMWYLNKHKFIFTFHLGSFRIDKERAKELASVGVPISFLFVLNFSYKPFGSGGGSSSRRSQQI